MLVIAKGGGMVDTRHRADNGAGSLDLGDEIGNGAAVALRPEEFRRNGHHVARRVDAVHLVGVVGGRQAADIETARLLGGSAIGFEVEPVGVGRVEEQFERRRGQDDMRIPDVKRDVAPAGSFSADAIRQRLRVFERLAE